MRRRATFGAIFFAALTLAAVPLALRAAAPSAEDEALYRWRDAWEHFREAGRLIAAEDLAGAEASLTDAGAVLSEPYATMAVGYANRLAEVRRRMAKKPDSPKEAAARADNDGRAGHRRPDWVEGTGDLISLCVEVGASSTAVALYEDVRSRGYYMGAPLLGSYAWALAEVGRPDEALDLCDRFLRNHQEHPWRRQIEQVAKKVRADMRGGITPVQVRERLRALYYPPGQWERRLMMHAAVLVDRNFQQANTPRRRAGLARTMAEVLHRIGDKPGHRAWQDRLLSEFPAQTDLCAEVHIGRAEQHHASGEKAEALAEYRLVATEYPKSKHYGIAQFSVGQTLQSMGRYEEAISEYRKLIESDVNDLDPSPFIMATFRNYQANAQWGIGDCFLALGDYAKAYESYRDTREKHAFQSWCGNCQESYELRSTLYEGLCLEGLGRYDQAVRTYFGAARHRLEKSVEIDTRLVDLYEAAGQLDDLSHILAVLGKGDRERAEVFVEEMAQKARKDGLADYVESRSFQLVVEEQMTRTPALQMQRIIEIRALEAEGDVQALVRLLRSRSSGRGPETWEGRRNNWQAVEAARALARLSEISVPAPVNALDSAGGRDAQWVYYALGLCGTPRAVRALRLAATREPPPARPDALVYSLALAGPTGERVIAGLDGSFVIEQAVARLRAGKLGEQGLEAPFPPIPPGLALPARAEDVLPPELGTR